MKSKPLPSIFIHFTKWKENIQYYELWVFQRLKLYLTFFFTCGVTFGVAFGFDFEEVAPVLILTPDLIGEFDGVGAVEVVLVLTTLVVLVCD